ncbi:MAG TPA: alpha/beta hydrolase [Terriglobales bacterium]|nr:alpha/beta hydrolase [Terriglobales bacterium]
MTSTSPRCNQYEQWVTVDGVRTRYLQAGSGLPLILIHGLLGYSFSWRFALPALAPEFHVIAPDLPGAGFSECRQDLDFRLREIAKRLLRFLDVLEIGDCYLLGSSHGGAVAMMAASLAPERIQKLVLVSPVNPWSAVGRRRVWLLSRAAIAPLFNRWAPRFKLTHAWVLRRLYGNAQKVPPGTLEGYSAPYARPGSFTHNLKILQSWQDDLKELKAALPGIAHIPTLLIWGTLDRAVTPASAHALKKQFRDARLVTLEGVGHLPYEEAPEEFNLKVKEFLEMPA